MSSIRALPITYSNLTKNASQHLQVHNVNVEVIINNKKTPTNGIVMVRLS